MDGGREGEGGWCGVIEFLSLPALSGLRLSVEPSVLGADRQVDACRHVSPLTSQEVFEELRLHTHLENASTPKSEGVTASFRLPLLFITLFSLNIRPFVANCHLKLKFVQLVPEQQRLVACACTFAVEAGDDGMFESRINVCTQNQSLCLFSVTSSSQ